MINFLIMIRDVNQLGREKKYIRYSFLLFLLLAPFSLSLVFNSLLIIRAQSLARRVATLAETFPPTYYRFLREENERLSRGSVSFK